MKNVKKVSKFALIMFGFVFILCSGCKKEDKIVEDPVPTTNNVFYIYNQSMGATGTGGFQFTYLSFTAIDPANANINMSFVSNPGDQTTIKINIPKMAFYKIRIFNFMNGQSVWWNSIALSPNGQTTINLQRNSSNTFLGSTFNNIGADGTDF